MPSTRALTLTLTLSGARETIKRFNGLPKEANENLRQRALKISDKMAVWIRAAALADSKQAAALADTVKARKDRVPYVEVGGSKRVTRTKGTKAYQLLFGANFGARVYRVPGKVPFFEHDHAGAGNDYWIFSTYEAHQGEVDQEWNQAAEDALAWWAEQGDNPSDDPLKGAA